MRYLIIFLFFFSFTAHSQMIHCGYDFTSYLVLDVHEQGKKENIKNLKITIIDSTGNTVVNVNNIYSWQNANKPLEFTPNYKIDDQGKRLAEGVVAQKERWYFPFAKDNYLLSVANTFPAENFQVKVEDIDGLENGGKYKTTTVPLYNFNMYVLCTNENQQAAVKFGPKTNRPIEIVLEKE